MQDKANIGYSGSIPPYLTYSTMLNIVLGALIMIMGASDLARAGYYCSLVPPKGYFSTDSPTGSGSGSGSGSQGSPSPNKPGCDTGGRNTSDMVATAWYTGWHSTDFTLSAVSWDKYTSLIYSFA